MTKRDITMIAITVILIGALVAAFIYDRNSAVLKRTAPQVFYEDTNIELVGMSKQGMMFNRVAYSAKFKIIDGYWENYLIVLSNQLGTEGIFMEINEFKQYSAKTLTGQRYIPQPTDSSITWMGGMGDDKSGIICLLDQEADGSAYIYLYYSK